MVEVAVSQAAHRRNEAWSACQTCKQTFTGPMRSGLTDAWCSRVCDHVEESAERLAATANLADALLHEGRYAEAEAINREVHKAYMRVCGPEHPETLASAANLALSISSQGRYSEAEPIEREVHAIRMRALGPAHPHTLQSTGNLAICISRQA